MTGVVTLTHNKVQLALHTLRAAAGRPLLLLHGLGEQAPAAVPVAAEAWPGPVHALDFTGHGRSSVPTGGGYTAEILMADAAIALDHLGPATVLGRGLGAYIALLIAGARPQSVRGAVLGDGPGLHGGGTQPGSPVIAPLVKAAGPPDPYALFELGRDVRPADYATSFVHQATHLSGLAEPVAVAAVVRPPWVEAILDDPGVVEMDIAAALAMYAALD